MMKRHNLRHLFRQGGTGSGNFGHKGRPGKVGGSQDQLEGVHEPVMLKVPKSTRPINFSYIKDWDEDQADEEFQHTLKTIYPGGLPVFHESSGHHTDSFLENGIRSDYGVFGTIGKPSGFVTHGQKTSVYFVIPPKYYRLVVPDMRYTDPDMSSTKKLLTTHNGIIGADVSFPDDIPTNWIKDIKEF